MIYLYVQTPLFENGAHCADKKSLFEKSVWRTKSKKIEAYFLLQTEVVLSIEFCRMPMNNATV
jgi:hypothetical protein